MKLSSYFTILASAALITVGCLQTEELDTPKEREIIITASFADGEQTKTTLMDAGEEIFWEPNEAIKVFLSGNSGHFESTNTETASVAQFRGYIESVIGGGEGYFGGEYLWGLYPYRDDADFDGTYVTTTLPSSQTGRAQSFASNTNITLSKSTTTALAFYNVCGGIRFSVAQEGIREVVFRSNNGENLAGKISLAFENGVPAVKNVENGSNAVRLTLPDNAAFEVGEWYYIVALPGALENGYTMTFNTQTQYAELVSSESASIQRGIFGSLEDADAGLTYQDHSFDAVDLGLSVKWATCNVGAYSPEGYGNYYAWGEIETKDSYDWTNYKWGNLNDCSISKYSFDSSYGTVDYRAFLDLEDDVAHQMWGGNWRMPTNDEWAELQANCSFTETTINGVNGILVTSDIAGYTDKSIFLPYAGYRDERVIYEDQFGEYWSSSLYHNYSDYARVSYIDTNELSNYYIEGRYCGLSVRPVLCESSVESVTLDRTEVTIPQGSSFQLSATILPSAAPQSQIWTSSNNSVAMVTEYGQVYGSNPGTCTVFVSVTNGKMAECTVTVTEMEACTEYVDLGLSVKWATCNVGASKPEDFGAYYSWGSTQTKQTYNWGTYEYGSSNNLTKYNTDSNYGTVDNKTVLDPEDDIAQVKWGDNWRMPTSAEWEELVKNCTWEWTTLNEVNGYKVISNKEGYTDKWIFLPATGWRSSATIYKMGSRSYYWSSSLNWDSRHGCILDMMSGYIRYDEGFIRSQGSPVRPVYAEQEEYGSNLVVTGRESLNFGDVVIGETVTTDLTLSNNGTADLIVSGIKIFNNTGEFDCECDWSGGALAGGDSRTVTVSFSPTQVTSCNCSLQISWQNGDSDNVTVLPVSGKGIGRFVDLGLSVRWATFNLGASKPEKYGRYFAWGDVVGQTWDGSSWSGGRFCDTPSYETDTNGNLKPEYDAAHIILGSNWRMPTLAEYQELIDNTTSTWTDNYNETGVAGRIFTSNKAGYTDKYIFLPAAGFGNGQSLQTAGFSGLYWLSTLFNGYDAWVINFNSDDVNRGYSDSFFGRSIRPVFVPTPLGDTETGALDLNIGEGVSSGGSGEDFSWGN